MMYFKDKKGTMTEITFSILREMCIGVGHNDICSYLIHDLGWNYKTVIQYVADKTIESYKSGKPIEDLTDMLYNRLHRIVREENTEEIRKAFNCGCEVISK